MLDSKNPIELKEKLRSPRVASTFSQSPVIYSPSCASSSTAQCISEGLSFYARYRTQWLLCSVEWGVTLPGPGFGASGHFYFLVFLISLSLGQPYGREKGPSSKLVSPSEGLRDAVPRLTGSQRWIIVSAENTTCTVGEYSVELFRARYPFFKSSD